MSDPDARMKSAMRSITLFLAIALSAPALAISSRDYLPADADLDPDIPAPEAVLGWEVGEWRVSHDLLVKYMEKLAAASGRVSIRVIGHTHEQRPLLQLAITSPGNQDRLEELRQRHLRAALGEDDPGAPLVAWLGHSIHGNEASGSNASMLVAYYLAASRSEFVTSLLRESVILLDPALNPDGLQRFAAWSNSNRSMNPVADPNGRIHNEAWPQNRTNHYLFDLNRDWLPLVHPESRARVAEYHRWLPHVLTDQHETTSHANYFFQPGVPERQHPAITPENLGLTAALAGYHAAAMDEAGVLYFTEDGFDDFYVGKGSTYPDINGGVGILFEQPRVNGPVKNTGNGPLKFTDAIANHLRTTLSTLRGAHALRDRFKAYQGAFFMEMRRRSARAGFGAWVIGDDGDPARARALLEVLEQHQVEYHPLAEEVRAGGYTFQSGRAWVLPVAQRQFNMLLALMESHTEFEDDTFYDVSAWTLPLAYNLPFARVQRVPAVGSPVAPPRNMPDAEAVAWIVPWEQLGAPALLQELLVAGARVRAATKPFTAQTLNGNRGYARGALVIHRGIQDEEHADRILEILGKGAERGMTIGSTGSGLTPDGPDLGASHFTYLAPVRPLMLAGDGVSAYEMGHAWHHFDQRLGLAPVMVEPHRLAGVRLAEYTHLVLVDGDYATLNEGLLHKVVHWVRDGGILVAIGRAAAWAEALCFSDMESGCVKDEPAEETAATEPAPYARFENDRAQQVIGGAIVAAHADTTHPLAYGLARPDIPLLRQGTALLKPGGNAYSTPVRYSEEPLLAGFVGTAQLERMRSQPAVVAEKQGRGLVIRFANDPVFRGFWRGTERLFDNAIYMGQVVRDTELPD